MTAIAAVAVAGVASLSLFPRGHGGPQGIYRDYSSPEAAVKSYISAVYAVDEVSEIDSATRYLRFRANRYRGWDVGRRWQMLAGKTQAFRRMTFVLRSSRRWGDTAQVVVGQILGPDKETPYTFDLVKEAGVWRISDMGPGDRRRY